MAECLIEDGYRICVIDPEGDYAKLGERPKVLTFGHDLPLPLQSGDFSRWVDVVLGDEQLGRGLKKIERSTPAGASPNRAELLAHIEHHYLLQPE